MTAISIVGAIPFEIGAIVSDSLERFELTWPPTRCRVCLFFYVAGCENEEAGWRPAGGMSHETVQQCVKLHNDVQKLYKGEEIVQRCAKIV